MSKPVHIVGDVHGERAAVARVLAGAGLISETDGRWTGGQSTLWFTGDFFDRGPDGIGAVDLVMRLQEQAADAGGKVGALLGNHDVMILAARQFGVDAGTDWGDQFMRYWFLNGGQFADLGGLSDRHVSWLTRLPALALVGDVLLAHADSTFYTAYGQTVGAVNAAIGEVLHRERAGQWNDLIELFTQRLAFTDGGAAAARAFLQPLGARRLVHGHSPIPLVTGVEASTVMSPHVYAEGLCVNVDAGLFMGAPGFVFSLPDDWLADTSDTAT